MGKAARLSSASMIRMVLRLPVLTVGRSRCARIVAVGLLCLSTAACGWLPRAPLYVEPTPLPELSAETVEMPRQICVGQTALFTVRTNPNNECFASVRYQDRKGSWVSKSFEPLVADKQGLCEWTWKVTNDVVAGTAVFRTGVEGDEHLEPLIPQPFQIQTCDR
jgi:hypothetical protein